MPHIFGMGVLNLVGTYPISYHDKTVGTAIITKKGLYYSVSCRCQLPDKDKYTIVIKWDSTLKNLGICIPYSKSFGMDSMISSKEAGQGSPVFHLRSERQEQLIPLTLPFAHIGKITSGVLHISNDQKYLKINGVQAEQDNDPIP